MAGAGDKEDQVAKVGDQVQVTSTRVGQLPREGIVTGVTGAMLRMKWSTGEESTLIPGAGSVVVIPKVRRAAGSTTNTKDGKGAAKAKRTTRGSSR
jgi:hypothetical protein